MLYHSHIKDENILSIDNADIPSIEGRAFRHDL